MVLKLERTPGAKGQLFEIASANVYIGGLLKRGHAFQNLPSGLINLGEIGSTTVPVRGQLR